MLCLLSAAQASSPVWTLTPLTATTLTVPSNDTAVVQYQITNRSSRAHVLAMQAITGVTQLPTGLGVCGNQFTLVGKGSCTLSLQINGSQLIQQILDGPVVCEEGSALQCYRPAPENLLNITQAPPITDATISVTGSPLILTANGASGILTINNLSLIVTATNIASDFTGTALAGKVTEIGNTCASVLPLNSCTLTYSPESTEVALTDFPIQGDNTNILTPAIEVDSGIIVSGVSPAVGAASGGTGVTLTGVGFTGATGVTFGGVAATSVKVVDSTTVTAVTPVHAVGAVDVVLTTSSGSATATNGYTYETTTVGQSAYGGTIACLNGGDANLIAATADNSTSIQWGGKNMPTTAISNTDGATNTMSIVNEVGAYGGIPYAAQLCNDYKVDSQGNTPCEAGNACYEDWFLPAGNHLGSPGQLNCLFVNRAFIGGFTSGNPYYWSSTEASTDNAWTQNFSNGQEDDIVDKDVSNFRVRCVRAFTP
ncbi:MAG: IPT/TIG domain-containing protein [Legionellaceae bacterium]|nr:IPT/TIG domain-containing protein [Legionellaceae bacterium]